jgi:Zn-dependent M28 family amino/carboxypeptidase
MDLGTKGEVLGKGRLAIVFVAVMAVALAVAGVAIAAVGTNSTKLRNAVTVDGILEHERAFQSIADANNDNRASGTPGYDASAAYVATKLRAAGYNVTVQPFTFPFFQETGDSTFRRLTPTERTYSRPDEYEVMEYSGSGNVTAEIVPTNDVVIPPAPTPSSTSGCEDADFRNASGVSIVDGKVALIQRGTCTFGEKVQNAEEAGAVAAIIFNEGQEGRTDVINGTLGAPAGIPALDTTFAIGQELYNLVNNGGTTVNIVTQTVSENRNTSNVIAETPTGRADRVAFAGAHLDSVPDGPGINDNGSGTATILEVAEEMSELGIKPRNKVRFAFWGAEESGLLGAEYYVSQLTKKQQDSISAYLNFDMVGSPNYGRFIYDGDGSATPAAGPNGSRVIEKVFEDYFKSQNLATLPTAFDGRSDYGPFIDVGIPAGGLFTGAEDVKTAEEAELFGGLAGEAFDPCYHSPCDSFTPVEDGADAQTYERLNAAYEPDLVGNLNVTALDEMSDATAHALLSFAQTTSSTNGTDQGSGTPTSLEDFEYSGSHAQK